MPQQAEASPAPRTELKIKRPFGELAPTPRRVAKPKGRIPVAPTPAASPDVGPAFLRLLLWVALVGWLLLLAFKLLDPLPFLFPDEDDAGAYAWWRATPQTAAEPARTATPTATERPVDDPEFQALKRKVAEAMLAGSFADALALIERQRQLPDIYTYQAALAELAGFVRDVSRVNTFVADAIREHIDKEVVIRIKDRRITMIPRASAGERINAVILPARASQERRSATFSVSDLDPIERAHWIGQADTPRKCAMKLLLHLQAGDRDGARVFAPGCGIMADAFEAQLGAAPSAGPAAP